MWISGITHERGAHEHRTTVSADAAEPVPFYRSEFSIDELAARAAGRTLEGRPRPDLVIYATSNTAMTAQLAAAHCGVRLGLRTVNYMVMSGHACANIGSSLSVAEAFIGQRPETIVLLATVDRVDGQAEDRIVGDGVAVLSDAAAACIVTGLPVTGAGASCAVRGWHIAVDAAAEIESATPRKVLQTVALLKRALAEFIDKVGVPMSDVDVVVFNNVHRGSRELMAWAMGVPGEKVYDASAAQGAHMFAADVLISIEEIRRTRSGGKRSLVLAVSPGVTSVALILFEIR